MDLWQLRETSLGGNNWGLQGLDEKSGYLIMIGMKKKELNNMQEAILGIVFEI